MADSHLGFDLPVRPRVQRRRRGFDFQGNHDRALAAALEIGADLVVHGGDLFHRPGALPSLAYQAFQGLLKVADAGIPVFVVPGNHERARIPHPHLASHPNLHVFATPRTVQSAANGVRVAVAGFPYRRRKVRDDFPELVRETGVLDRAADLRLLCMHHCVEGATVGPSDFTFRNAPDVVRGADLPSAVAAVLSGHIHRPQILTHDLRGRVLRAPVVYPGSVERTAFAEIGEEKGFFVLDFSPGPDGGRLSGHRFVRLPARPMEVVEILREAVKNNGEMVRSLPKSPGTWTAEELRERIGAAVTAAPDDAVLRLRIHGAVPPEARISVSAARLREMAPPEMNLEVVVVEDRASR